MWGTRIMRVMLEGEALRSGGSAFCRHDNITPHYR